MRKTLKFFHTVASCGMIGALLGYGLILLQAPQDTPAAYAAARQTIPALCTYILIPSMALAIFTGLIAIAVHRPFQELRWVWVKAALGLSLFEATLGLTQSKANSAASLATKMAQGEDQASALAETLAYEWHAIIFLLALSIANIVLGVWRPILKRAAARVRTRAPH